MRVVNSKIALNLEDFNLKIIKLDRATQDIREGKEASSKAVKKLTGS